MVQQVKEEAMTKQQIEAKIAAFKRQESVLPAVGKALLNAKK
jgi:hypothetical protein